MKIEILDNKNLLEAKEVLRDAFWREGKNPDFNEWEFAENLLKDRGYIKELCLVALQGDKVVGYSTLTRASIGNEKGLALGPIGIKKQCQRQGIGKCLVKEGIKRAKDLGYSWIALIGGNYYSQFSFESGTPYHIILEEDSPENNHIQILFLDNDVKAELKGKLVYCDSFYDEKGELL